MIALAAANASTPATMIFRAVKQDAHRQAALGLRFNGNRTRAAAAARHVVILRNSWQRV